MKVLELFKGSGSISKHYKNNESVQVISLDFDKRYEPDILTDIMEWNYKEFPTNYFDIIWASPECKVYSNLQYTHIIAKGKTQKDYKKKMKWSSLEELGKVQEENKIYINKTIEIIEYFKPKYYFIENPFYSNIWNYVDNKKYLDSYVSVDYCAFGYRYKKPTKILTNKKLEDKRCVCTGNPKHGMRIGAISKQFRQERPNIQEPDNTTLLEKYSIPPLLLKYLLD